MSEVQQRTAAGAPPVPNVGSAPGAVPGAPSLVIERGSATVPSLRLDRVRVRIGRSSASDLQLVDDNVSRAHAEVAYEDGRWVIEDLKSSNGVVVDGQRVSKAPLAPGARITLGRTELRFDQPPVQVAESARVALLGRFELLHGVSAEGRRTLAASLVPRYVPEGGLVLAQGAPIATVLFVLAGRVRIVEVNDEGGERAIGTLGPGESYGERALLPGQSGPALVAEAESCLLELPQAALHEVLRAAPDVGSTVVSTVRNRLRTGKISPAAELVRPDAIVQSVAAAEVEIVGEDKRVGAGKKKLEQLAKEGKPLLLVGAAGTGKRTFARFYHRHGSGADEPYLEVSLADLEPVAVEAALFGVEPGPGASASSGRIGYLEMLGTGTLAIAHAERLGAHEQKKLFTYLKLGWFHKVYGQTAVRSRCRVLLLAEAENEAEGLEKLIPELREELKAAVVALPPLAQRLKDIPLLAEHMLKVWAKREGRKAAAFSREALDKLVSYAWPGNLAELENVIQRAAIVATRAEIIPGDLIFVVPPEKEVHKLNVLRDERVRETLRKPWLMSSLMWFNGALVALVTLLTLYGGTRPAGHPLQQFGNNFGMVVTWLVWFPLLPISAFLVGRVWCGMCPIAGFGDLAAKIRKYSLPVPRFLKRMDFWLVVASFLFLDYIEEFAGVADKPLATGVLLVVIIGLSALFCVLYERKTFCRYLCPLAGMLGAYATMSVVEVRGNKKVCQTQCGQHTCFKGTDEVPGCPLFAYPASITTNLECMMCLSCLKSCDHRGVQVNLRPPLQELWRNAQPMLSLSLFAVMLVGMMGRHQFPALTFWQGLGGRLGWSEGFAHTVLFVLFLALALAPFALASTLSAAASQERLAHNMATYGIAFVPLAFSGHVAHVAHEWLGEGLYEGLGFVVKLWDRVAHGVPFASSQVAIAPFVQGPVITFLKFLFVTGGALGTLVALVMIARRVSHAAVGARILPHLLLLLFFWVGYLLIFTGSTAAPTPVAATPVAEAGVRLR